ncbi:hypothetical protein O9929_13550 [Vibrio lentus]|nr:hypothetical protein [Vibrio lentus]
MSEFYWPSLSCLMRSNSQNRSEEEVTQLAEDFKDWSKVSNGWRFTSFITANEKEAVEDFSIPPSGPLMTTRATDTPTCVAGRMRGSTFARLNRLSTSRQNTKGPSRGLQKTISACRFRRGGRWSSQHLLQPLLPEVAKRFSVVHPNSSQRLKRVLF